MYLDLAPDDRDLLIALVERQIKERRSELRRGPHNDLSLRLKDEVATYERLLHRLHEAEYDVRC